MKKEQLESLGLRPAQIETVLTINRADLQNLSAKYIELITQIIKETKQHCPKHDVKRLIFYPFIRVVTRKKYVKEQQYET